MAKKKQKIEADANRTKSRLARFMDECAGYCFSHSTHIVRVLLWCCVAASVVFALLNVVLGPLNQDEGWYLYAALEVAQGRMPYKDFFFTQGPVMPAIYALLSPIWAPFGILGGRCLTAFLGLLATYLFAETAANCVRRQHIFEVRLVVWALSACNLYHSYFNVIPKTYALGSCLLAAGFLFLSVTRSFSNGRGDKRLLPIKGWAAILSGFFFALAGGTRASLVLPLPIVGIWLIAKRSRAGKWSWFRFALGGALGLLCVYGPALLFAREEFLFAHSFHGERTGGGLLFVAGALARLCRYYLLMGGLAFYFIFRKLVERPHTDEFPGYRAPLASLWIWCFCVIFAIQLMMPVPYDDYQVPIMGVGAMALAICCVGVKENARRFRLVSGTALLALTLFTVSSPMAQRWFFVRQDCFWTETRKMPALFQLRVAAVEIRRLLPETAESPSLLTMDTYLAVEAGLPVPQGMEMGPFSYFPELTDEEAARFHVHNTRSFLKLIQEENAPIAALSGYSFTIGSPKMVDMRGSADREVIFNLIRQMYAPAFSMPDFGQNNTRLEVFALRREKTEK